MTALSVETATELGRIFNANGTGIDVVRKLAIQYPKLSGHQLTNAATQWDALKAKTVTEAAPQAVAAAPTNVDGDRYRQAADLLETANAVEAKPLSAASTADLYALAALHFPR